MMQTMARRDDRLVSRMEMQALLSFDQLALREDLARRREGARGLGLRLMGGMRGALRAFGLSRPSQRGEQR
jgi:hypothetical protein